MSLLVFTPKCAKKLLQKVHINCKKCNLQQQVHKKPEHCSTPPRDQGPFQHGNTTGTVPGTGYGKPFVLQFGTKRYLRVLQKICIFTKNSRTCSKCMKKCKKLGYCSTAPRNQGQFHNEFSIVIPLEPFSSRSYFNCYQSCLRM